MITTRRGILKGLFSFGVISAVGIPSFVHADPLQEEINKEVVRSISLTEDVDSLIREKINEVGQKYLFESNNESTRYFIRQELLEFLHPLQKQRKIYDYMVSCDERNNTSDIINNNGLKIAIYIKPIKSVKIKTFEWSAI